MLLVSLRDRNCQFWSHDNNAIFFPYRYQLGQDVFIHLGLCVKKNLNKKAKHHHIVSFRVFMLISDEHSRPYFMGAPPPPSPTGWYSENARARYLGVSLIFRFLFLGIHFVQNRLQDLGRESMSKPYWSLLKRLFKQMNTVNPLRLKIRWSQTPLLEILLCSHWMEKTWTSNTPWSRPHMSDGLLRLMDSCFSPR